ncbi:protein-L-isoaspartate O-methyltransferase [Streptomyces oryzae]|uniref:Protein-L-isoaspartate O-methyltransferase n=1 Tax=Streptomyces oryzae TaxID=1434886 RepID=A0ABS3X983_9ACTN|nr:methyltransferase domain-containing protein [Streptomyces oryzae]MBO8191617.1 protein-L-isoaspartate O-methyltransferase [Streptomyces oryzae]
MPSTLRVLELGIGTGWNAALLVYRAGPGCVVSVELDDELAVGAEQSLARAGAQVSVCRGDGATGCPGSGPYDRVLSTYAVETIPFAWVVQTRPGGRIVTPWGRLGHVALTVSDDGRTASGHVRGLAQFMPARAHAAHRPDFRQLRERHELAHEYHLARDLLPLHRDWHLKFALRVALPELRLHIAVDADECNAWLHDETGRAWASLSATGSGTLLVREGGSRRLAGELLEAWDTWLANGSPDLYEYGLTVTEHDQYAWARNPDTGPRWTLKEAVATTRATV